MADERYTNADLDTAETLLIGAGRPELAQAMRRHAEGVRNLVQGEWGQQSVTAMEGILQRLTDRLTDRLDEADQRRAAEATQLIAGQQVTQELLGGVQGQVASLHGMFSEMAETVSDHGLRLSDHDAQLAALQKRMDRHEARLDGHDTRLDAIERELADVRTSLAADRGKLRGLRG